jgi:hypothetical protein
MRVRAFAVVAWCVDSRHHAGAEETIKIRTMPGPTSADHQARASHYKRRGHSPLKTALNSEQTPLQY